MARTAPRKGRKQRKGGATVTWLGRAALVMGALGVPFALYAGLDALLTSRAFLVKSVVVEGNAQNTRGVILQAAGLDRPRNLLGCDAQVMERSIEMLPWISDAAVDVSRAGVVTIRVEEARLFAVATLGAPTLIDIQGVPIRELMPEDTVEAPLLVGFGTPDEEGRWVLDEVAFDEVRTLLALVVPLEATLGRVREVHYSALIGFRIIFDSGLDVRLGRDRFEERVARLQETMAVLTREQRQALSIVLGGADLDRVVVRLAEVAPSAIGEGE
jgi:cell division protein FtsQ